ncbi:MAG: PAS domain S-box protein [Promethearchaeota archaeon]
MILKNIFEKEFIENVINASEDTIFVFDPQTGKPIIWNEAFRKISGYSDDEIQSLKAPNSYYNEEDLKKAEVAAKEILESGKTTVEMTLITKDGQQIPYEYSGTKLNGPDGNILIVSVGRNITERKEMETKLRESEEKYRSLFENMNAGFAFHEVIIDDKNKPIDYKYIEANPAFEKLTGLKKENLIGKNVTEAIPGTENDPADWIGRFGNVGLTGIPLTVEEYSEAIQKWFRVSGYSPKKGYFAVTFTDITDMKIAEQKLKESEEKFRNITEQSLMGIVVIQDGIFKYFNDRVVEINGYPSEEIKSWAPNEFSKMIHPEDREFVMEQAGKKQIGDTDVINHYSFRIIKKNGDIRWLEIFSKTINYEGSTANLAMTIDNTDKYDTEKKLRESEARYRILTKNTNMVVWSADMNLNLTFVSSNSPKILGYTADEAKTIPMSKRMTPESLRKISKIFSEELKIERKADKDLNRSRTFEIDQIHKNGYIIPVEITFTFLRDDSDNVVGFLGVTQDVSERKKAEQKLKESEEKYRKLFNNAPFVIVLFKTDGFIVDCNDQTYNITGYSKEELIGNHFKNFNFYVDIRSANLEEREKQISSGMVPKPREILLYKKDGSEFWARNYIDLVDMGGETYIQAIIHDITEQKESTFKLHESEKRLKERVNELNFLFELSKITEMDNLTYDEFLSRIVNLIPQSMQFPDLSRAQIKFNDKEFYSDNFETSDWKFSTQIEIAENPLEIEIYYIKDKPFLPEEKKLTNELGIRLKTILEKKESEQKRVSAQLELEKSYERLKELENIINRSPGVLFLWQNSEGWPIEFVSENVKQFGYTQEEFYSGKLKYEEIIYPDDLGRVAEEVNKYSNDDINEFVQEYRIITRTGDVRWLDDRTWIRRDSDGNITHFQGIVLDITDRKNAEVSLTLSEKNYREAYDQANFYKDLFTHDMNNILQVINSSAELISFNLGESEKSKEILNISNIIKKQVERGAKLITNVRTLTELDGEKISIYQTNLHEMINNAIKVVEKAYDDRLIKISIRSINEKLIVNANELLQHVFENILINSIKYNENSKIEIDIRISKEQKNQSKKFKIEIIDNGIGIPDDKKNIIFKPGNRELKGSKGMGLGLSLVSKILNTFKGEVLVEDRIKGDYSKGSNFVILLPIVN